MPRLFVCGKGLHIAGDEIQIPMLFAFWSRTLWTTILIVILYLDFPDFSRCINGIVLLVYLILSISNLGIAMILDILLLSASLQGTMIQMYKRRHIPFLFMIRMVTSFFEVFLPILGIIGLTMNDEVPCHAKIPRSSVNKFIFGVIVISQVVDIGFLATCYCLVVGDTSASEHQPQDQSRRQSRDDGLSDNSTQLAKMEDKFRKFARQIEYYGCSNFGGGKVDESLEGVAHVMTKYFENYGFIDVVPSDIVAGIILVRAEQRRNRNRAWQQAKVDAEDYKNLNGEEIKDSNTANDYNNNCYPLRRIALLPKGVLRTFESDYQHSPLYDLQRLKITTRCATYSAMIYNRLVPIKNQCCVRCCQVQQGSGVRLCGCCCWIGTTHEHKESTQLEENDDGTMNLAGMNFIGYNRFGFNKLEENVVKTELIFLSHYNDMVHKPFAVFLDHELELVVLAIRGTVSVEDCLSDVACEPVEVRNTFFCCFALPTRLCCMLDSLYSCTPAYIISLFKLLICFVSLLKCVCNHSKETGNIVVNSCIFIIH